MVLDESGGICERKTLFQIKKKADQVGFKGTRTEPLFPSLDPFYLLHVKTTKFLFDNHLMFMILQSLTTK